MGMKMGKSYMYYAYVLKGQTDKKNNLMDEYLPLGDTRYVFRIWKYII